MRETHKKKVIEPDPKREWWNVCGGLNHIDKQASSAKKRVNEMCHIDDWYNSNDFSFLARLFDKNIQLRACISGTQWNKENHDQEI